MKKTGTHPNWDVSRFFLKMNIILAGFMGTGKTAVGKALAKRLEREFVDLDDVLVEREGMPIADIFAKKGEPYFRKIESEVVKEHSGRDNLVIAAGGGAMIAPENVRNFKANGKIVCLTASPETILARTKGYAHRPLLNVPAPKARIKALLGQRAPFYAKADYTVDTDGLTVSGVADRVLSVVGLCVIQLTKGKI